MHEYLENKVDDMAEFVTQQELDSAMGWISAAPHDHAPIESLCFRAGYNRRAFREHLDLTVERGIPHERWLTAPWMTLPDGAPDPRIQVSILSKRVMDTVWRNREDTVHPGDTVVADLNTSEEVLAVGTRLALGTAVVEVSDAFNDGCVKWKARYGAAAKAWITQEDHVKLRLRGVLCRIVQDGRVHKDDVIKVMR